MKVKYVFYFTIVIAIYNRDGIRSGICYIYSIEETINCYCCSYAYILCIPGITVYYSDGFGAPVCNRKAKCYIPELLVELNSLFKQRDAIRNGNIMMTPHIPRPQKICSVCNYRIDKGYHICKPNPSRPLQS